MEQVELDLDRHTLDTTTLRTTLHVSSTSARVASHLASSLATCPGHASANTPQQMGSCTHPQSR
jgi:hypothetical protein